MAKLILAPVPYGDEDKRLELFGDLHKKSGKSICALGITELALTWTSYRE